MAAIPQHFYAFADDPLQGIRPGLAAVQRPTGEARGLPSALYTDPAFFILERERLMADTWVCIGFAGDLPSPGYVKPVDFMGLPLVILRDRQGEIKVFHNVCSHRGRVLVHEETKVGNVIRCPYHSWTYGLDGQLRGTPHIGGFKCHQVAGFSCADFGLRRVRSWVWLDMVFINLCEQAPTFPDHIAPLEERWRDYVGQEGLDRLRRVGTGDCLELEVGCNWKLAVENYCESYHLPWVHPGLNAYSRLEDHYPITLGDHFSGQGSRAYNLAEVAGTQLPSFPDWPRERLRQAEYIACYPNVLLGLQADHAFALMLEPRACNRTREHLRLYYVGDQAAGEEYAGHRQATLEAWRTVFAEDIAAVEGMQWGRASPAFTGGVFSPVMDVSTHHFHRWVAAGLEGAAPRPGS